MSLSIKQLIPWNEKIVSPSIKKAHKRFRAVWFQDKNLEASYDQEFFLISVLGREGMKFKKIK